MDTETEYLTLTLSEGHEHICDIDVDWSDTHQSLMATPFILRPVIDWCSENLKQMPELDWFDSAEWYSENSQSRTFELHFGDAVDLLHFKMRWL